MSRRLRALMISDVYFPRVNGVSTSIQTFRAALEPLGIDSVLVAPDYPGAPPEPGIVRLPSRAVPLDPEDRLMHWGELATLDRRLASADFDVVHIQTPFAAHYAGLRFARRHGLPCLATYHTHFEEYLFHYIPLVPRGLLRAAARHLARRQCDALDAVVVPSVPMAETLRHYGVSASLRVIPTGLPAAQFERGNGHRFRARHAIDDKRRVALFVGRVAHEKNIGFLLDAVATVRRTHPDILLLIAGEGPALNDLKRETARLEIAGHVRFVGYLDRATELRDCYAAADLFVFASHTETQGLVLLEALASGLPVLAIPALGAAGIVSPQRGARAASAEPATFAAQMAALLDDPDTLARMRHEGIAFACEWGATRQAENLAATYRELAQAHLHVDLSSPLGAGHDA